jgi:putative transcriptional regulator
MYLLSCLFLSHVLIISCSNPENSTQMKNNLKVERAILGLTQEDLARKIGVSRQTINAMEANKYVPSTVLALRLAKVFGKRVEDIFQLDESDE